MILETKRLLLREMTDDDIKDVCDMLCNERVMYAYEHAFSLDEALDWLHRQMKRYQDDGVGLWAIIRKSDQVMLGQCGITRQSLQGSDVWEIGYLLKEEYWGQGYAREAAQGCKTYAFEVMKFVRVYSIIRNTNMASKRVAIANGMVKVGSFIKDYFHMKMPHDVYCAEHHEVLKHVYVDAEFDAIKINKRFQQMVISIGAIVCDDQGDICSTFYETVRPKQYQRTSRVVLKMTGLNGDVIRSSKSLNQVLHNMNLWLKKIDEAPDHFIQYSFGPDDKRTIQQHCKIEQVEEGSLFNSMKDLQKPLSAGVTYQQRIVSPTLSLNDLKLVYRVDGVVEHNALTDAIDLMKIHLAYRRQQPCDEEQIRGIVQRKEVKKMLAKEKQQRRLCNVLRKRFSCVDKTVCVSLQSEVLEQFHVWEAREEIFTLHFKKTYLSYGQQHFEYDLLKVQMRLNTKAVIPYVLLHFDYETISFEKKYVLHYKNATIIECIMKQSEVLYG